MPDVTRPLEVLLLHDSNQLMELVGRDWRGAFAHDSRGTLALLTGEGYLFESNVELELVAHELTHYIASFSFLRQPRWLAEGLATYFQTIEIDPVLGTGLRGKANQLMLSDIGRWGVLPIEELWRWDTFTGGNNANWHRYASAWFWVHLLTNRERPAFDAFLERLRQGEEPRAAWEACFSHLSSEDFARAAEEYLQAGQFSTDFFQLDPLADQVEVRPLPDAEVHAALSRAAAITGDATRARREAVAGVKLDPKNPRALQEDVITQSDPQRRLERARRLTTVDPSSADAWLLLALATEAEERTQALEKSLELEPHRYVALIELASSRSDAARHSEAVALAEQAVALAPFHGNVLSTASDVFFEAGQCAQATRTLRRAIDALTHQAPPAQRTRLRNKLNRYEQCTKPAP